MRRDVLALLAAGLIAFSGGATWYLTAPTHLMIAVGPAGSADEKLFTALAGHFKAQRAAFRLHVKPTADLAEAAGALDRKAVDLAVVRPDVKLADEGLTLTVLRDAAVILIAPKENKVDDVLALGGRSLGVVPLQATDPALIGEILTHYDLEPGSVPVVPVARDGVLAALKERKVAAVAFLAAPGGTTASEIVRTVSRGYGGEISLLAVDSADALAERAPVLSTVSVPEGTWGGRPRLPEKEMKTLSVSYRLMARSGLDRLTASQFLEALFQARSRLAVASRSANFMHAPNTDNSGTTATLPNHPGAVDYFQRETVTLTDKLSEWIYLLAFIGSGIVSLAAWLFGRFRQQRRDAIDDVLDRLLVILAEARGAGETRLLDDLTREVDELLVKAVGHARAGSLDTRATSALALTLDGARAAIEDKRREIVGSGPDGTRREPGILRLVPTA